MIKLYTEQESIECDAVCSALRKAGVHFEEFDIAKKGNRQEFGRIGGVAVPFLVDTECGVITGDIEKIMRYVRFCFGEKSEGSCISF